MIQSTHTTCNSCANPLLCVDQGECMFLISEKRRKNRLKMDKLSDGERWKLMFGHKLPPKDEDFAAKPKQQPQP